MRVRWTTPALIDLNAIGDYVAQHDPGAATRLLQRVRAGSQMLARHPYAGREIASTDARKLVVSGTSYNLIYAVRDLEIEVLAVFHQRRNEADLRKRGI